jgi:hypothetical protein
MNSASKEEALSTIIRIEEVNGKTYDIYSCDFEKGEFISTVKTFGYDDIHTFFIPKEKFVEIISAIYPQVSTTEEIVAETSTVKTDTKA